MPRAALVLSSWCLTRASKSQLSRNHPPVIQNISNPDGEEGVLVAEVFVFIEEDGTPPCWALNRGPTHAVEILPLTHASVTW